MIMREDGFRYYAGMKEMRVAPLPLAGECGQEGVGVLRCSNLRRDDSGRYLVAAGRPARSGKLDRLPLATWRDSDGVRRGIVQSGSRLRLVEIDGDSAGYDIGAVAGAAGCIVMTRRGRGVAMTDEGCHRLRAGGDGKWRTVAGGRYPALRFEADSVMRLSADAEERELSGSYNTRSKVLCDADADRLGKDLARCYRELADKTTRGGMELQPVLVRYRLEGDDGEVLYRSPVVQAGAPSGVQCVDELRCELSDDGRRRGRLRLAADVYRLRLRQVTADTVEPGIVKRLVVETSLPVHPLDSGVIAANALGGTGTNGVLLRCFVPGASVTMVSARRHVSRKLCGMAAKGDAAFREALVVQNPFDSGEAIDVEVPVARGGVQGVDGEQAVVAAVLGKQVARMPELVARCRVPNSFTAACGCVAGDRAVWGGITTRAFSGYRVEEMASAVTPEGEPHPWRCVVVTELGGGGRSVATSWGTECAPLQLSPLLWSPRADAVRMTVMLERDGTVYKGVFAMTADESRSASYHFNPDCRETELEETDEEFAYISGTVTEESFPSALLIAPACNPLDASEAVTAGTGRVVAAMAVDRRGSAWEFGTGRVYAMTGSGIYMLSLGAAGGALRCDRLDRRGVAGSFAVSETDDDRYPLVCIASGDLLGLSRGNVSMLREATGCSKAGWDSVKKELWLADGNGRAVVMQTLGGGWREVAGLSVTGFHDTGAGLLVESDLGVRDTALGESAMAEFAYAVRCDMRALEWYGRGMRLAGAGAELRSANVNGVMRVVTRTIADADEGLSAGMEFRGEINTPLLLGLRGNSGAVIEVEVFGEMESGSAIRDFSVYFR